MLYQKLRLVEKMGVKALAPFLLLASFLVTFPYSAIKAADVPLKKSSAKAKKTEETVDDFGSAPSHASGENSNDGEFGSAIGKNPVSALSQSLEHEDILSSLKKKEKEKNDALDKVTKQDLESLGLDQVDDFGSSVKPEVKPEAKPAPNVITPPAASNKAPDTSKDVTKDTNITPVTPPQIESKPKEDKVVAPNSAPDQVPAPVAPELKEDPIKAQEELKKQQEEQAKQKKEEEKKRKAEEKRKKIEAAKELKRKEAEFRAKERDEKKQKTIAKLRADYLEEFAESLDNGSVKENFIVPKRKVAAKFVNYPLPSLLIERPKSEENSHHPNPITMEEYQELIFEAIAKDKMDAFRAIFKIVKNPDLVNSQGDTLLTFAVVMQKPKAIAFLLANGADPNLKNDLGYTPLNLAIELSDYVAVDMLANMGADLNFSDSFGVNYLMEAVRVGYFPIVDLLVEKGIDVNIVDDNGIAAIDIAYRNKDEIMIKYLKKRGAKMWSKKEYVKEKPLIEELKNRWR